MQRGVEAAIQAKKVAYHRWQEEENGDNWREYEWARIEAKSTVTPAKRQKSENLYNRDCRGGGEDISTS